MPFFGKEATYQKQLAREAEKFARHVRSIPVSDDAGPHASVKQVLDGFKRINKLLSQRNAKGEVPFTRTARVGREFQRIGATLRKRPTARRRPRRRTTKR